MELENIELYLVRVDNGFDWINWIEFFNFFYNICGEEKKEEKLKKKLQM